MAGIAGLEPAVQESKSCALTNLAIPLMVLRVGLGPTTRCLQNSSTTSCANVA